MIFSVEHDAHDTGQKKGFFARWFDSRRKLLKAQREAEKEEAFAVTVMLGKSTEHINAVVNGLSVAASDLNLDDEFSDCDPGLFSEIVGLMEDLKGIHERVKVASRRLSDARVTYNVKLERSYARRMAALRRELGAAIEQEEFESDPDETIEG